MATREPRRARASSRASPSSCGPAPDDGRRDADRQSRGKPQPGLFGGVHDASLVTVAARLPGRHLHPGLGLGGQHR